MRAALVDDRNIVINFIEVDPDYEAPQGVVLVKGGIEDWRMGDRWDGSTHTPGPRLTNPGTAVPPDGSSPVTVTYRNHTPDAPTDIVFTINGHETDPVPLDGGVAEVDVSATEEGKITVEAGGLVTYLVAATVDVQEG